MVTSWTHLAMYSTFFELTPAIEKRLGLGSGLGLGLGLGSGLGLGLGLELDGGVLVAEQHVRAQLGDVLQTSLVALVRLDGVLDVGGLVMYAVLAAPLAQQQGGPLRRLVRVRVRVS